MSYEAIVPEDDRTSFDLYRKCVGELLKCAFLKNTKLKMNLFSAAEGSALEGVNHDEFKSFLTTFRQFTLQDHTNFYATHNRFQRYCPDDNLKKWVAYARKLWKETMAHQPFRFDADGEAIDVEESLRLHFYSGLAHFDAETTAAMDALPDVCTDFMKMGIVHALGALIHSLKLVDTSIHQFQTGTEADAPVYEPKIAV